MKKSLSLLVAVCFATISFSQNLPDEMHFSTDGHQLLIGGNPSVGLYDSATTRTVYLTFDQNNYWSLLTSNYQTSTDIPATMVVDGITYDSVGVRFKGQTSYSQSGNSQKKSFNISLDEFISGQDILSYQTMNLNNAFQDPSFLREVFYLNQIQNHIPAAKANFVSLYINGASWGIYPNVQQINNDFIKEWFLTNDGTNWRADDPDGTGGGGGGGPNWGDGTAALNYLGTDSVDYQDYYTLKSTQKYHCWEDLITTCDMLCNTPLVSLEETLNDYMDVDRALWFLASEILFSDDDSYIYKGKMDYYCYWEPETGRMTPQEFDGNSVMDPQHDTWDPFYNETDANYPLMYRLFQVDELRQRYLAHLRTLINEIFDPAKTDFLLDHFETQIDSLVSADPKKLYTYNQFLTEVTELKNFIDDRNNFMWNNAEVNQTGPAISNVAYYDGSVQWDQPEANENILVRSEISSSNGISAVSLYYSTNIVGKFSKTTMFDDGAHDDGTSGDGVYAAEIPAQTGGTWIRFYIEAASNNTAKTVTYEPVGAEHNVFVVQVHPEYASNPQVVINEVMASNSTIATDEAGEYEDWIELYNLSNQVIDMSGYYITDNLFNLTKWDIPSGTTIGANDYLIIWADEDSAQGTRHSNFKLSKDGEALMLLNANNESMDEVSFSTQQTDMGFARVPNGTGSFVIQDATYNANNNWSTAVDEMPVSDFSIYPNPTNQWAVISGQWAAQENLQLKIFNTLGQEVHSEIPVTSNLKLQISNWASGIYFVRYGTVTKKLVVEH